MKRVQRILSVAAAAGMMLLAASTALRAEKAGPTGQTTDFFPPPTDAFYDPQASGTKFSGTLAVAYDKSPPGGECSIFLINRMSVVLTLAHGNELRVFTTAAENFCFDNQRMQVETILALIREKVVPFFYNNCDPNVTGACPGFKVKSVTNFTFTTPHTSTDTHTAGANSAEITIAVQ